MPAWPGTLRAVKEHPVFASLWDRIVRMGGKPELENRRELIGGASGRVLEVGAGTGLNFRLYGEAVEVVAIEPEPNMARRARERAAGAAARVRLLRASAEELPFGDAAFDTVVASLVFCTIPDPGRAAREVGRVLKPGGTLRLYEHVRSPRPRGARWQDRFLPVWRFFGGGCHPNRDTVATFREAGFDVEVRSFDLGPPSPVRPHVLGVARPR
jgi:ubiquinone/menaquinone biosynthesis C-methylase UbiE